MNGIQTIRFERGLNKTHFMIKAARMSGIMNMLSNIGLYPKIDKMVIANDRLVIYKRQDD